MSGEVLGRLSTHHPLRHHQQPNAPGRGIYPVVISKSEQITATSYVYHVMYCLLLITYAYHIIIIIVTINFVVLPLLITYLIIPQR